MGIFCDFLYSVFRFNAILGLVFLGLALLRRRPTDLHAGLVLHLEAVLVAAVGHHLPARACQRLLSPTDGAPLWLGPSVWCDGGNDIGAGSRGGRVAHRRAVLLAL